MRRLMIALIILWVGIAFPKKGPAKEPEYLVYNIYQGLNLGNSPSEAPEKDYYLSIGSSQGVQVGTLLKIVRRVATFNLVNEQLYRDMAFPIALVKVIHVESTASVARLEKWLPKESTPSISPKAVMLGDLVRFP